MTQITSLEGGGYPVSEIIILYVVKLMHTCDWKHVQCASQVRYLHTVVSWASAHSRGGAHASQNGELCLSAHGHLPRTLQ